MSVNLNKQENVSPVNREISILPEVNRRANLFEEK